MSYHSRDIHSQSKKNIFNVYTYFKNLAKDSSQPEVSKFFLQSQQKTSEACGIHIKSVKRITAEVSKALLNTESGEPSFTSPRKTFKRLKYATGIDDFDEESKLVFRCTSSVSEDYHSQMNSEVFKEWFIQMLSNLEEPCVVVMDNASYHSVQINNYLKSNAKKIELQEWLKEKEVDFSPMETVSELRERIKRLIPHEKKIRAR